MTDDTGADRRVLVPVEVLEGETVPEAVADLLSTVPVVVLGYHVLPEQTPPDQAQLQFEDRAQATLEDLAAAFRAAGGDAETRLVFTHDEEQTVRRVATETGCAATLVPNPSGEVRRLLVPARNPDTAGPVAAFVAALVGDRKIEVTLVAVAEGEDDATAETDLTAVADRFREHGLDPATEVLAGPLVEAVAAAAADHDAVVMGESAPSVRTFLFGEAAERVAARSLGPVIAVHAHGDGTAGADADS